MAAVVAVAGAGVEQRVAAEERGLVGMRQQADMAHRVTGRVHAFEIDGCADLDDIARADAAVHVRYTRAGIPVRDNFRIRGGDHALVAADVVAVLVRIHDLGDSPAPFLCHGEAFAEVEGIDGKRFAGLGQEQRNRAGRVPRGVYEIDRQGAKRQGVAIVDLLQVAVGDTHIQSNERAIVVCISPHLKDVQTLFLA